MHFLISFSESELSSSGWVIKWKDIKLIENRDLMRRAQEECLRKSEKVSLKKKRRKGKRERKAVLKTYKVLQKPENSIEKKVEERSMDLDFQQLYQLLRLRGPCNYIIPILWTSHPYFLISTLIIYSIILYFMFFISHPKSFME